jgi:NADH dehydrogenase
MIDNQPTTTTPTTPPAMPLVRRPTERPHVVIVGAGFGGLSAVRAFANRDVAVTVVDKNNYHGFWPLLYQVATAGLEPESIAYPIRGILRHYRNAHFEMAEVKGVDFENREVLLDHGTLPYDYLILAAGSTSNYFGNTTLERYTMSMKDLEEAERLRNHVLTAFEQAVREPDPAQRKQLLTFVVIGGGPTGVELAGAFAELIRYVLRKDYPTLDVHEAQVVLIEAAEHVLAPFPDDLRQNALKTLERMGVEVRLKTLVASADADSVTFKDGSVLAAKTIVWAAGVRGAQLADALGVELGRGARVKITAELHLPDYPEVFVIGDMAYLEGFKEKVAYPMVAPVAIQQGQLAAKNILSTIAKQPLAPFTYFDKGQMATIGRRAAVLDGFGLKLTGFLAWIGWLVVHILELIGFRNRLVVLTNWAYNYFTYGGGMRLITWTERVWYDDHKRKI